MRVNLRSLGVVTAVVLVLSVTPAGAQDGTLRGALQDLVGSGTGSGALTSAFISGPALELATAPLGSATGGFSVTFDPSTGGFLRGAETFGPAFAQRALTTGRAKASFGITWQRSKFDEIAGAPLDGFVGFSSTGVTDQVPDAVVLDFDIRSWTTSLFATVGVTDRIDIGALVPISSVSFKGSLTQSFPVGPDLVGSIDESSTGIGDIGLQGKVQMWRSRKTAGATGTPSSALAAVVGVRLPTGDEDNLRGLGFARTKVSAVFSQHAPRFAIHANAGYEFWSDQLQFATDLFGEEFAETKGAVEFAVGAEVAASARLTLNVDLLVQQIRGAGALAVESQTFPLATGGSLSLDSIIGLDEGYRKVTLAPGVRWNLFGQALLNAHVLVSLQNEGLRAKLTPSIGFDWTF